MSRNKKKPISKRPNYKKHRRAMLRYLRNRTATASMVSSAIGIPKNEITWYKRDLEKSGLLWLVRRDRCQLTGHFAWYLSTSPRLRSRHPEIIKFRR